MRRIVDAYFSSAMKCWVRMERLEDGEWCHTSGFTTRNDALKQEGEESDDASARRPAHSTAGADDE